MILNQTPLKTSNNYKINNIELKDFEIPKEISKFQNVDIIYKNAICDDKVSNKKLTYGLGEKLQENVFENANHKLKILLKENESINICYNFDDNNINLINNIEIVAEGKNSITIKYQSNTNKECFHNGIIKLIAKENAKVDIAVINLLNESSNNFEGYESQLEKDAKVKYTIIDIGGKTSITNYYSNIIGQNAKNDLKTIYLGVNNQLKDLNYIAHLRGEKANIDIDVQGALQDSSKKNFKGTIDFKKGCKKAKGNENEYCMLLSEKAKSIALPMLLCTEDDVEGNHSTSAGKIQEKELFYIMSRGLSKKEAIKLIVRARFNKIIERIKDEELQKEIIQEIDKKL